MYNKEACVTHKKSYMSRTISEIRSMGEFLALVFTQEGEMLHEQVRKHPYKKNAFISLMTYCHISPTSACLP